MKRRAGLIVAIVLVSVGACGKKTKAPAPTPETSGPRSGDGPPAATPVAANTSATRADWVPNEHKTGKSKWKDATVYVDGVPHGVLWFGELPTTLPVVWHQEEADGDDEVVRSRRYRISDYLKAVGVNLRRIREVHIYGGIGFAMRVTGRDFRRRKNGFQFRFGRETGGKPLLVIPSDYDANTSFDHVHSIAVYVDKPPPTINEDDYVVFRGEEYTDVPYYGTPLRGGIRVYLDNRLATTIKRRLLEGKDNLAKTTAGGQLRWQLMPFLKAQGVPTQRVVVGEVIHDERRVHRYSKQELADMFFLASPQGRGKILLGADNQPAQALALFTKPQPPRKAVPAVD